MNRVLPYLFLIFATVAWGTLFHVGKDALSYLDPFWFTTVRYVLVGLIIVGIMIYKKDLDLKVLKESWFEFMQYGVLGYVIFAILVFIGLNISIPSHGAVVMATMPITTLFMKWLLFKDRPNNILLGLASLGLIGVCLVTGAFDKHANIVTFKGDFIAYIGSIAWIFYSLGQQKYTSKNISVVQFTGYTVLLALPVLFVITLLTSLTGLSSVPSLREMNTVIPSMGYVAIIATLLPTLAYNSGIKSLGPLHGIIFINLVPISAFTISTLKGQIIQNHEIYGTLIVVFSLILQVLVMNKSSLITKFNLKRS